MDGMKKTIYADEYKTFIKRLKEARIAAGLTQVEVAKKLGSTQAYISKVEKCQLRVDALELKRLAKIYGKSVGHFLR
jgi:transcriptional regulator with XRE-family HTH domain